MIEEIKAKIKELGVQHNEASARFQKESNERLTEILRLEGELRAYERIEAEKK